MKTLRERLAETIYEPGPLGVDADRVPVEDGVRYVEDAVREWLLDPEFRPSIYRAAASGRISVIIDAIVAGITHSPLSDEEYERRNKL